MRQANIWIIGPLAGIAGGLMALAGLQAASMAAFLLFAAPIAIYLAALGWGPLAGIIAAMVATALSAVGGTFAAPVATGTLLFAPAAWAGHLVNLARRDVADDGGESVTWFPLSGILFRLMLILAVGFIVTGWAIGFSGERVASIFSELMGQAVKANPDLATPGTAELQRNAKLYAALLPVIIPAVWLMMHVLVMHLAAIIAHQSGRLPRPAEDIAASANLPVAALFLPIAGVVGITLFSGPAYEVGAVLTGIGLAGFGLVGLAELHFVSRGRPGRGFLLFAAYLTVILFSFPLVIFAAVGVRRALRRRHGPRPPQPPARRPNGSDT